MPIPLTSSHTLILWDIDGTLLHARGAGKSSMIGAIHDVFGVDADWGLIDHVGRTDAYICRCITQNHGVEFSNGAMATFTARYTELLRQNLQAVSPEPLPGAHELLKRIHSRTDITQGLLTGNFQEAAFIKLAHFGLEGFFDFGAYSEEHEDRCELAPIALRRAHAAIGQGLERIVLIGDTHHDAACGRALGARVILVATGAKSMDELAQSNPDLLLPNLAALNNNIDQLLGLSG